MKYFTRSLALAMTSATISTFAMAAGQEASQQQSRIDFGNAYIQGQSIKSGAVYLTNRRKSKLESLLKDRENYRYEILNSYFNGKLEEAGIANESSVATEAETTD